MAGIEEKNDVAFLHRGEERLESLVEIALAAQFGRQRNVLLVEAHLLEVGGEIARVIVGSREAWNILVGVALFADQKSAPRLRARSVDAETAERGDRNSEESRPCALYQRRSFHATPHLVQSLALTVWVTLRVPSPARRGTRSSPTPRRRSHNRARRRAVWPDRPPTSRRASRAPCNRRKERARHSRRRRPGSGSSNPAVHCRTLPSIL